MNMIEPIKEYRNLVESLQLKITSVKTADEVNAFSVKFYKVSYLDASGGGRAS